MRRKKKKKKKKKNRERKIRVNRTILRAAFRAARVKSVSYSWLRQGGSVLDASVVRMHVETQFPSLRRKLNALTDTTAIPSVNAFSAAERLSRWTILLARGWHDRPVVATVRPSDRKSIHFHYAASSLPRPSSPQLSPWNWQQLPGEDNTPAVPFVRPSESTGPVLPMRLPRRDEQGIFLFVQRCWRQVKIARLQNDREWACFFVRKN